MFVLQKRICVRQEQPLCSRISWDHQWITVLPCFVLMCKPLLEAEVGNQYLLSAAKYFTKWLDVSPVSSQETLRVIKFLTRSDKVIYRDGFETIKLFGEFTRAERSAVRPSQCPTGLGKSSLGLGCLHSEALWLWDWA